MAQSSQNQELIDRFGRFYRNYYRDEISRLAQRYPNEQRSLHVDYDDLYQFDPDLAEDYLSQPDQLTEYAEEALRVYDLPADVSLGQAHVRLRNLPDTVDIRSIRVHDNHVGRLIAVSGIIRKATDVRPKITEAAFECQRCGTMTYIPQTDGGFQEPHECQGCERQGPFRVNYDQSEFVDSQKIRVQESPEGLRGGETPQSIDIDIEDDITGEVTAGDHVTVTGVLHIDQVTEGNEKSQLFDLYMDGVSVEIEDEQFEEMEISETDKREIIELSNHPDLYDEMVASLAPSIYGYDEEKLAMILQLFSGVTKELPDGTRIRGDLHMLLIGDPGTGKCVDGDTRVTLADGRERPIRELVERNLDDPTPVDDGVYDDAEIDLQSVTAEGQLTTRQATRVWKREAPAQLYRIRTASGRELDVTPSHPLFTQDGGRLTATRAETLDVGERIATPRRLGEEGDDTLDVDYRQSKSPNTVRLDCPEQWTPRLARLVGYIVAEGHVISRDDNTADVRITNQDDEILSDASQAYEELGLTYTIDDSRNGGSTSDVRCTASEFISFLEHLEPAILRNSAAQRVPDALFTATKETKQEFLRAYVDAEGHVSETQREITVASMSRELLEGAQSLLLACGVQSSIAPRANGSYRLRISGEAFETYVRSIGFVTDRKTEASRSYDDVSSNTNVDIVPEIGDDLRQIRKQLQLTQFDCGIPRTTDQHYERGDRNPSRQSLKTVVDAFRTRLTWLQRAQLENGSWEDIEAIRQELNVSQRELADRMGVEQTAVSYYERNAVAPDGGRTADARDAILKRIDDALSVSEAVDSLEASCTNDIVWDRIESIEAVEPDDDWVYDLEVADTHTYLANGVVSHNSQLLSYIRNIAPRSIYTSGKGSSSAGLCVTGDTLIHTADGFKPIRELATPHHPSPVDEETAAPASHELYTFGREDGAMTRRQSSHVWRMPEKPCRRIETAHGKELETSVNTPVLVCGDEGIEWREMADVDAGEFVAVPKYDDVERSTLSTRPFFEFTEEKLKPTAESVEFLRNRLREEFGTLRDAAAALDLPEDFIYDSLSNRHLPQDRLDHVLDAVGADRMDIDIERAMLGHGNSVTIPDTFDADLMYLVGLVFGDGDIMVSRRGGNRGHVRISNSNEELLRDAARIVDETFDKSVDIERQPDRVPCIRIHSATIARFFQNLGMESPKDDLRLDPRLTTAEHADAFLRGLFDADGSVSARDDGGSSIQFSTISDALGQQVQLLLETYGIRARRRERDRRGTYELETGHEIESKAIQTHLAIYGKDIDTFAERVGFRSEAKTAALETVVGGAERRGERLPVSGALAAAAGPAGTYYQNFHRGDNPSRERARAMLADRDLGDIAPVVREAAEADLVWDKVVTATDTGKKELFDLTVPETNNFVGNGIVTHNTAAAVRDDFGEGQQWSLEAGALVLADQGIAAVDELDKMRSEDRSAMHQALEQQEISISKAGINATLKSRCSLLGAANPKYGRFDQYEPIGEQIDLEPALVSRFDLIFTVTDQPDPEEDAALAEHILRTNYAGELNTQRTEVSNPEYSEAEVESVTDTVEPAIDPELLRKYIAYAKRSCFPTMTDEAKAAIRDFYVDLRAKGADEDAPVPVTARKLEALVRLAEASARVRLSDTVEQSDAERVIEIVRSCLQDIGVDPETGEFDADVIETGTSKSQRDRIKSIKDVIETVDAEYEGEAGAPIDAIIDRAAAEGIEEEKVMDQIEQLRRKGDVYSPTTDQYKVV
ncbi:LAGLIDADG family homing endonuclease [Haloplanus halobius]|uniref:LAGLIDADG family homing endonuclease n=1 Tax=Haloplanus halobius TaxID=2934938 RepID=UPI00200D8343|nr:LAGLIDADG family homing endonuclease [Haloplanus sp. XH21]